MAQTIGRYEIQDELGQGGMAAVYLALDPYIKRQVAVKVMAYQLSNDPMAFSYFQREAEVIAALEHECIVPIFDFGQHGDQLFLVMRYMTGGTLEQTMRNGRLRSRDIASLYDRIAQAMDAAHARGIIHRDVKPGNILFDDRGKAFVADFGLAKWPEQTTGMSNALFVGTPEYMSPEQARMEALDGRSDIYALGVMLFELLTGQVPFDKGYPMGTAVAHVNDAIPDMVQIDPDIKPEWVAIVHKAMAKKPDDRYQTAAELAQDVKDLASGRLFWRDL